VIAPRLTASELVELKPELGSAQQFSAKIFSLNSFFPHWFILNRAPLQESDFVRFMVFALDSEDFISYKFVS